VFVAVHVLNIFWSFEPDLRACMSPCNRVLRELLVGATYRILPSWTPSLLPSRSFSGGSAARWKI